MEKSLLLSIWEEYRNLFLETSTFLDERNVEDLIQEFNEGGSEIAVLGRDHAEGFCIFRRDSPYSYYIDYLGVPEQYQGRGVGRNILQFVINNICFQHQEIDRIWLLCNDDKIAFYTKLGFEIENIVIINQQLWNKMVNKK